MSYKKKIKKKKKRRDVIENKRKKGGESSKHLGLQGTFSILFLSFFSLFSFLGLF
jgi:hypothetical protein